MINDYGSIYSDDSLSANGDVMINEEIFVTFLYQFE